MYDTEEDLRALLGVEAESVSLDFKDGIKLNNMTNEARKELVVDVTAMANSGGGTIIYGLAEAPPLDGRSVAGAISPVTDERVTQDRIREIVYSNTDPALSGFTVKCIPVAGGRVIVVDVAEGDTAYQNKMDRRYYNRVDASSAPMYGFAVRDVMHRRSRPNLQAQFTMQYVSLDERLHRYHVVPTLHNVGNLTASHWALLVGLPSGAALLTANYAGRVRPVDERMPGYPTVQWFEFSSERHEGGSARILPGQSRRLSNNDGFAILEIQINEGNSARIMEEQPPLRWMLFLDDSPRTEGELAYEEWCRW